MPIAYEVTLYGCCWKCGGRRTTKRKLIEKHEETCFANPARRACKTCKHDIKGSEPRCALDEDVIEQDQLHRPESNCYSETPNITCVCDCPAWEAKR